MKFYSVCIIIAFCGLVHAEDWTVAGRTYQNVKVTSTEADCVHVMYDGGIGTMKLADLTPDLQKRFNYAPAAAAATSQQREADRLAAVKEMEASRPVPPRVPDSAPMANRPGQTAPATIPAVPVASSKPAIDRPVVQDQIDQLNHAIAVEEAEVAKNAAKEMSHRETSQNPYRDLIAEQHREIDKLTAQLNGK